MARPRAPPESGPPGGENRHGAANLSLFRKLALSLLKQNPRQESMARKRKAAAVDPGYLAEILTGPTKLAEV